MIAQEIVAEVKRQGAQLRVVGGALQVRGRLPTSLMQKLRQHRAEIIKAISPPPRIDHTMPALPRSVRACLAYLGRHPDRDLTPKLHAWLDKDWQRIELYERAACE